MSHSVDIHVGNRIRQRRQAIGMTLTQLANALGVKFQQIQKYEASKNRVAASRLWEISVTLGVPVSYFFEGLEGGVEGTDEEDLVQPEEVAALLRAYHAAPDAQRKFICDLACALRDLDLTR